MDREFGAKMSPERMIDKLTSARWRSLCERFAAIRLGAYRNDLEADWQALAAKPPTPGLLDEWDLLEDQIAERDDFADKVLIRGVPARHDDDDDEEYWAGEDTEFFCPGGRCDRRVSAAPGTVPHCDLLDRAMAREAPDSPVSGGL